VIRVDVDLEKRRGGGKTVLVVDDNPWIRQEVCRAFLSDGFAVAAKRIMDKKPSAYASGSNPI
jgi:hypothetical protein